MGIMSFLLDSWTPSIYVLSVPTVWLASTVVYRLLFHPLAKVPGPFLPAVTHLYAFYFNVIRPGQFYKEIERIHVKYGPIVRIAPNEVHLSDPENYDKIYSMSSRFSKDPNFYGALGIDVSTFATIPNELHRIRRSALNPFFSRKMVLELEEVVQSKVQSLCQRVRESLDTSKPIDLHSGFRAISMDVITDYAFNNCSNSLRKGNFGAEFSEMVRGTGPMFWFFQQFPALQGVAQGMPYWLAKILSPSVGAFLDTQKQTRNLVGAVKSQIEAGIKPQRKTIFHLLLNTNATEGHVVPTVDDLADESFAICTAAADTTGNCMTIAAYNVVSNPTIYSDLKKELRENFPDATAVLSFTALERLPYLTAVIKEALRLSFGVIGRLPRVTPEGGATFNGYYIPPGTVASMSSWTMHRNSTAFPTPDTFDPTRWLDVNNHHRLEIQKCLVPFSRGSRMCVGMPLAYCELYCTLGTLFRRFEDLKVFDVGPEDLVYEDFFSSYHPLGGRKGRVVGARQEGASW